MRTFERRMVRMLGLALALLMTLGVPSGATAQGTAGEAKGSGGREYWYVLMMQDKRAGWMRTSEYPRDGKLVSSAEMEIRIKRNQLTVAIGISTEFVESMANEPVSMMSTMKLGQLPQTTRYRFLPDGVEVESSTGGNKQVAKVDKPQGAWDTPRKIAWMIEEGIAAGKTEFSTRSLDPSTGLVPATTTMKLVEKTTLDVMGKAVPALKWTTTTSAIPGESVQYTDERGEALRTETSIGGIQIIVVRADKALAMSGLEAPEILNASMVVPDKPISGAQERRKGVFVITSKAETLADLPSAGAQTVERVNAQTIRVKTDASATSLADKVDVENPVFRTSSAMISSSDERVKQITAAALKSHKNASPTEKAEILRAFVHGYINKKTMDVGFATATEVAQTRQGDCTEHGVLLAAMLRAADIPSRVVSGLVYVDGIKDGKGAFGYHMWAQALVEIDGKQRWMDVDAALSATRRVDATHIALQTLGMADGDTINALVDIVPTMGALSITVESVE